MSVSLNITKIVVPEGYKDPSEIQVVCDYMNLNQEPNLFEKTEVMPITSLVDKMKSDSLRAGNYYIKKNLPVMLDATFKLDNGSVTKEMYGEKAGHTVVSILTKLSNMRTNLEFRDEYYNNVTSGTAFDNFLPDFNETEMNASNLIISAKKFNIVLTATIKGVVRIEDGYSEIHRFHPFKLVKFGQLQHNNIYAVVDDTNESFLRTITNNIQDGIATIDLTEFPIFETENVHCAMNNFLLLTRDIQMHKLKIKGLRYHLTHLRSVLDTERREWFNGEEVDEDYLSDEGTAFIDIWEKGKKQTPSIETLMSELGSFGESMKHFVTTITSMEDINPIELEDVLKSSKEVILGLMKDKTISREEAIMLLTLTETMSTAGTKAERLRTIINLIKAESVKLNALDLKFLTLRWNMYYKKLDNHKLGNVLRVTKDRFELESTQGTLIIKHGLIEKHEGYKNFGYEGNDPIITESIYE